jgi:hypothetical protein
LAVFVFGFKSFTWSQAVFDVIFQANFKLVFGDIISSQVQIASAKLKQLFDDFQKNIDSILGSVRSKINGTIFNESPRKKHSGKWLVFNADVSVRLAILKHHVISGLKLFD